MERKGAPRDRGLHRRGRRGIRGSRTLQPRRGGLLGVRDSARSSPLSAQSLLGGKVQRNGLPPQQQLESTSCWKPLCGGTSLGSRRRPAAHRADSKVAPGCPWTVWKAPRHPADMFRPGPRAQAAFNTLLSNFLRVWLGRYRLPIWANKGVQPR